MLSRIASPDPVPQLEAHDLDLGPDELAVLARLVKSKTHWLRPARRFCLKHLSCVAGRAAQSSSSHIAG